MPRGLVLNPQQLKIQVFSAHLDAFSNGSNIEKAILKNKT
jgi:hypothetical protein